MKLRYPVPGGAWMCHDSATRAAFHSQWRLSTNQFASCCAASMLLMEKGAAAGLASALVWRAPLPYH
jgi:hypothetical protein